MVTTRRMAAIARKHEIYVKKSKMSNPVLPEEIVEDIVSRLPVKSLLQCKVVCKSWYAYIISPLCIANRRKNTTTNGHKLICAGESGLIYSLDFNESDPSMLKIKYPRFEESAVLKIWGSCNGILCITTQSNLCRDTPPTLCLWIPSTREYKELTLGYECYCGKAKSRWTIYGFYYNANVEDYEIMEVICYCWYHHIRGWCEQTTFRIFSVLKNTWGEIQNTGAYVLRKKNRRMGILVQNALHWVGNHHWINTHVDPNLIVAFDIVDKKFREVALPSYESGTLINVAELDGCLCLLGECGDRLKISVMKEYGKKDSWNKVFEIHKYPPNDILMPKVRPLYFGMEYAKFIEFSGFRSWFLDITGCPVEWGEFRGSSTTYQERFAPLSLDCSRFVRKNRGRWTSKKFHETY